jgi:hypothetical protein
MSDQLGCPKTPEERLLDASGLPSSILYSRILLHIPSYFSGYREILLTFRTGSRAICTPAPKNTDDDHMVLINSYIIRIRSYASYLEKHGWKASENPEGYSDDSIISLRKGEFNLLVTENLIYAIQWHTATLIARHMNLTSKTDRISVFKAALR